MKVNSKSFFLAVFPLLVLANTSFAMESSLLPNKMSSLKELLPKNKWGYVAAAGTVAAVGIGSYLYSYYNNPRVIKGNVCIVPNPCIYQCGKCHDDFEQKNYDIKHNWQDPLVQVFITTKNPNQMHPQLPNSFPSYLPFSLFEHKKENEVVTIMNKSKNLKIELTCNQLQSRYKNYNRNFETMLNEVKDILTPNTSVACNENVNKSWAATVIKKDLFTNNHLFKSKQQKKSNQ